MEFLQELKQILIPIVAIVGGLTIPILWIRGDYTTKQRLIESRHKERLAAIERGLDYQPDPLDTMFASSKPTNPNSSPTLLWGLILSLGGAAVATSMSDFENGSVLMAVGAALLLYHFLTRKRQDRSSDNPTN